MRRTNAEVYLREIKEIVIFFRENKREKEREREKEIENL